MLCSLWISRPLPVEWLSYCCVDCCNNIPVGIVSPWESHCQSPDSSLPAQTCEFNFSHTRRHRAWVTRGRGKTATYCNTLSGLWSHFQVSNLHLNIWILSYLTCGSDLRVEELRRNTNVHAGVNRESLFVIFIGVLYCCPFDKCSLLLGLLNFQSRCRRCSVLFQH